MPRTSFRARDKTTKNKQTKPVMIMSRVTTQVKPGFVPSPKLIIRSEHPLYYIHGGSERVHARVPAEGFLGENEQKSKH